MQVVGITPTTALVVMVLSNGAVEKHTVELGRRRWGRSASRAATAHLAAHLTGAARAARWPTLPAHGRRRHRRRVRAGRRVAASASTGDGPDHVFVGGTSQVARAFDAIETVREVLGVLEQQYVVVTLLRDVLDRGLQVAIGTETGMAPLAECALIVAPYQAEGEPAGTIGVLGPSRMDYPQAMAAVAVVSHRLSQRLTEG